MNKKPLIAVPIGDPAGVGPEIVAKSLALSKVTDAADVIVVGDKTVMEKAIAIVGADLTVHVVDKPADGDYRPGIMNLIDLDNIDQTSFQYGNYVAVLLLNCSFHHFFISFSSIFSAKLGKIRHVYLYFKNNYCFLTYI